MGLTDFSGLFLFHGTWWWTPNDGTQKSHDNFFSSGRGVSNSHIHCRWHISCQEGREAQRIALEETRLGIPLIYGSDACWSFMGAFKVKVQNTTFLFFGEQYPHHICADLTYYTYYTEIILFVCPHVYICWIHFHVFFVRFLQSPAISNFSHQFPVWTIHIGVPHRKALNREHGEMFYYWRQNIPEASFSWYIYIIIIYIYDIPVVKGLDPVPRTFDPSFQIQGKER